MRGIKQLMSDKRHYEVNECSVQVLESFTGQKRVVNQLKVCLENSWNDGVRLPHILMAGEAGLGKTQICQILAKEMGTNLKEQLAQNLTTPAQLKGFLLEADTDKDVLMVDEVHQMSPLLQTTLYRALENRTIFINGNHTKKTHTLKLANFTLLAATTDPHMLLFGFCGFFLVGRKAASSTLPKYFQPVPLLLMSDTHIAGGRAGSLWQ